MQTPSVVFEDINLTTVKTITIPEPEPGTVGIRTLYSSISGGTEGWALGQQFTWATTPYPCVPGYQRVGVIEALGDGVEDWQVGDKVFATIGSWDGPVKPFWGAHIAYGNTRTDQLFKIPDGVDDIEASATVVAQVGYNAASRAALAPGAWALVCGDGMIAQCAAQAIRTRGAQVILIGHREERLQLGAAYSSHYVINSHQANWTSEVLKITGGQPVDVVLDSVQSETLQKQYMDLLTRGVGQIVYCGFTPGTVWADMGLLQQRELTTHFVSGWTRGRIEATLHLMQTDAMQIKPLLTHIVSYTNAPEMYRMNREKNAAFLGMVFDWTEV
jgi:2-desacetyl-2-hydroxyethyl bacteriochlorophyllide A dehydrogenase